jgi:tetratricopeptide (TPR) repeat protein
MNADNIFHWSYRAYAVGTFGRGAILADAEQSEPQVARFRAFVSYSHADAAIAQKLHRQIETYRLPVRLRADQKIRKHDGRLGRIFRDREDLPAAKDLSESVKHALAGSEVLVVVCSPDARKSIWVTKEIELFRALHPDRPILAALVRGEPQESFPALLLEDGAEPLAADLRKQGDGWRLGFLKIVAGIADVPLDALIQRDAARRMRRVMAVTGGALVALLAMIGMTVYAIQSRNEAQHQQAEAEGLVEYMLTDLRTELKGVGRLDVMTKVNERAMDYYNGQADLSDMPAESLERRARILHAMGEDDEKRGNLDKALAKFTEAHRVTEALLARDPENPDRIFGHAQSEYWVGRIAELREDWDKALHYYRAYAVSAKHLVKADGENPDFLLEMGWGYLNKGIVQLKSRQEPDYGLGNFREAIVWMEKANAASKGIDDFKIQTEIGNAYAWLADSSFLKRNFAASLSARFRELKIKQAYLEAFPASNVAKFAVAKSKYAVGKNLMATDGEQAARPYLRAAMSDLDELITLEPLNTEWSFVRNRVALELDRKETENVD